MGFDFGAEVEDERYLADYLEKVRCEVLLMDEKTYEYESEAYGNTVFNNITLGAVEASTAWDGNKVILNGNFSINLVKTAKYGNQVQLQVYTKEVWQRQRYHTNWARTEIFLTPEMIPQLIDALIIVDKMKRDKSEESLLPPKKAL